MKICVFTGTRADYGLLKPLIEKIDSADDLELQLIVSGTHLSPEFGLTYREIEKDGFYDYESVEIILSADTPTSICKSIGLGFIGFGEAIHRLAPDIFIVLGDRFEAFAAAASAMVNRIPIAHIHGGESTQGVIDEAIRHAITKMSHLHFTSTKVYRKRVIQLGENPDYVFDVGSLGIEVIRNTKLLSKNATEKKLGMALDGKTALLTFHPETLEKINPGVQFREILIAIESFADLKVMFTKTNPDTNGRIINKMIDDFTKENKDKYASFISMGNRLYLSALYHCDIVIGNSSSGIIEAPSLNTITVNIGERQKGRIMASSIINAKTEHHSIMQAIKKALSSDFHKKNQNISNPYEKENTSSTILNVIRTYAPNFSIKKPFFDLQNRE
jgi:GDP/UDP-N,N'-diacetylbacillosamine 2-epimerase (hydrolysing)